MSDDSTTAKKGQLIIVGSGIASISHLTLQAVSAIENADIVCYVVADGATEAFIRKKNPNSLDLYHLYGEDKQRTDTYIQMAEFMLIRVRQGQNVVGVFYGHPGVFVCPTHRALYIARSEGYRAKMLPGLSAEDCLFADLGIDPSSVGCVTYEATDLLVFKRPINTGSHLVLYQVGIVGKSNFKFDYTSDENVHFNKLLDRLEEAYGSSHIVTHYIAPLFPTEEPTAEEYTIAQLRLTEIQDKIHTISTFYVPPKASESLVYDEALLAALGVTHKPSVPYPWNPEAAPYGPRERKAIELLAEHEPPKGYRPLKERSGLLTVLEKLCLEPVEMKKYNEDRRAYADNLKALTKAEKDALVSGDHRNIAGALKVGDTPTNPAALVFTFIITRLD